VPESGPDLVEDEGETEGDEGEEVDEETPPAPVPPVLTTPSSDPLLDLPPERRAALLALDETIMADPAKRAAVFGILSGDSEAPPAPKPTLPDHIDPDSFEGTLWREQQETRAMLEQIAAQNRQVQEDSIRQRANAAAVDAGNRFAQKYADKLSQDDVIEIAQFAGQSGITASFANTAEARANPTVAFEQALEHTLWTNEAFRARVLGTSGPVASPGDAPAAVQRKRKLTALSGAASPVAGPGPRQSPIEHGVDGKLTEKSRQQVVKEAANMLRQSSEGI
jgi:hypothetical protein